MKRGMFSLAAFLFLQTSAPLAAFPYAGDIYFPNEDAFRLDGSCSLDGKSPCEFSAEYDFEVEQRIADLMEKSALRWTLKDKLINSVFFAPPEKAPVDEETVSTRIGFIEDTPVCSSKTNVIYPRVGRNALNEWVFILNQKGYKQGIKVETCYQEGSSCDLGASLPFDIKTSCKQKHVYRKMLSLNKAGNDIVTESVYLPSCCVCYTKSSVFNRSFVTKLRTASTQMVKYNTKHDRRTIDFPSARVVLGS